MDLFTTSGILHERPHRPNHAPTLQVPYPIRLSDGGVVETRKAPPIEGASFIFGAWQKKSALSLSGASGDGSRIIPLVNRLAIAD